jgi:hypothetical protein
MRTCKKCLQQKSLEMFKKHTHGYRHTCKQCQYTAMKLNSEAHANAIKRNQRYRDSEQGKAQASIYNKSDSGKASRKTAIKKYEKTERGALNKYVTTAKRRAARIERTPSWLNDDDYWVIKETYHLAKLRTKLFGFKWHVDHIVPLQGKLVSGLHVPTNLQVIPWLDNQKKHNKVNP